MYRHLKKWLPIILSFLLHTSAYAAHPKDIFYQALNYSKENSPFTKEINWALVEKKGLLFIGNVDKPCRGTSAISNILAPELRQYDFHSLVTEKGLGSEVCPAYQEKHLSPYWHDFTALSKPKRSFIKKRASTFWGKRFGDVAYIYVPSGYAFKKKEMLKKIKEGRRVLEKLSLETAKGLIVDFRLNVGGNNVPMLLALSGVLSEGVLYKYSNGLSVVLSDNGNTISTLSKEGEVYDAYHFKGKPIEKAKLPMAILIDKATGSSGAISAFALKENTVSHSLIGERSSDSLSINESISLKDGNYFNLMILNIASPSGITQPLYLSPDIKVKHDFEKMFSPNDPAIMKALEILRND